MPGAFIRSFIVDAPDAFYSHPWIGLKVGNHKCWYGRFSYLLFLLLSFSLLFSFLLLSLFTFHPVPFAFLYK